MKTAAVQEETNEHKFSGFILQLLDAENNN